MAEAGLALTWQLILVTVAKETAAHEAQAGLWLAAQINGNAPVTSRGQQIKMASGHSALRTWSSADPSHIRLSAGCGPGATTQPTIPAS